MKATLQTLQQGTFSGAGLMRDQCRLNFPDGIPIRDLSSELGLEFFEQREATIAFDDIGVGNRICRSSEEIGETDLFSNRLWNDREREIK